jgi:hypothetical protein
MTFDHEAHAAQAKSARARREAIAEAKAKLMAHAKHNGWGEVEGLPTMTGDCLVYHFTSGRRGIVRLPPGSNF